jgi:hypothetical protein
MSAANDDYFSLTRSERIAALGYDYGRADKVLIEHCNLCCADDWTIVAHRDRYGFPAQAMACNVCGLMVLNPRLTMTGYEHFYGKIYRPLVSAFYGRRIDAQTVQAEQQQYALEMETLLGPYVAERSGATFLDVGGSTGVVSAHFVQRFGLQATVLDPAPDEVSEARALGIETITALVENWNPGDRRFTFVGMFQTIDHLFDALGTLTKLRALIAPDGWFFVDIVDVRAAYLKNWSVEQAVKIDHPYSFTEATAVAMLARAGFRPVRKAYSADHHLVGYVCRPVEPDLLALPTPDTVTSFFREVRFVQNAPRSDGGVI